MQRSKYNRLDDFVTNLFRFTIISIPWFKILNGTADVFRKDESVNTEIMSYTALIASSFLLLICVKVQFSRYIFVIYSFLFFFIQHLGKYGIPFYLQVRL